MIVELWTRKRNRGWRWAQCWGYECLREIRGTTCLIGFRRPNVGVITCWIGSHTCYIRNGEFTCTQNSLKSQFLMIISHLLSSLSFGSSTQPSPKNPKLSQLFLFWHAIIMSSLRVLHTLITASFEDWVSPTPGQTLISHLSADLVVLSSLHSHNYELSNEYSLSYPPTSFLIYCLQINRLHVLL